MKNLKLELKAVDFRNTDYRSNTNCAIAKSLRREGNTDIMVGGVTVFVNDDEFKIRPNYSPKTFNADKAKASSLLDDETVRVINLIKLS